MRFHRFFVALLPGLFLAAPIAFAAEDVPLAPEAQRRVAVVVLARRIRGYAAMAKACSDCPVERGRLARRQAKQSLAISLKKVWHQSGRAGESPGGRCWPSPLAPAG